MKTLKMTLVATALVASFTASQSVSAAVSGNVALTTNYIWRGTTQNMEDPAIQGGFDFEAKSGFYAGAWASSVDFGGDESTELDLYAGYGFSAGPVDLDVGVIAYTYHGGATAAGDFEELYLGASIAGFGLTYSAGLDDANDNIELSYGYDFSGASLSFVYGDYDTYSYYSAGVSGEVLGLGWDITVADTDVDNSDTQVALTLSKSL
jgi:uncharacterized protein (TIGR02001 family)